MNNYKYLIIEYTGWCGLGFIPRINPKPHNNKYNNDKYKENELFLYSSSIIYGMVGIFIYCNPVFLAMCIHKELYRFEINTINL